MTDFSGRKAVISGATKGIGRAIAQAFLDKRATVIGLYGSDTQGAEKFLEEVLLGINKSTNLP